MFKFLIVPIFILFQNQPPVWLHNMEAAKETAGKEHKLILLNFSGSDWCIPCIKMHEDIFGADAFSNYANSNLVLVNADFPRKHKNQLTAEQQKINDALAEKYNSNGAFPYTILLDDQGHKLKVWDGLYKGSAESFIDEVMVVKGQ